jgi:hypothetical protein
MKQNDIQISMTEFVNFINASGMAKVTIVSNAKMKHEEIQGNPYDYWKDFKEEVRRQLINQGTKEDLKEMVEDLRDDVRENYRIMIEGFLKFWKPSRMKWLKPMKKMAHISGVKMNINPEIGVIWQNKKLIIKLFLKANETLDKRHADIILALMESELREKTDEDIQFAVLDVKRGKLFTYVNNDPRLLILLKREGRYFADMWKDL